MTSAKKKAQATVEHSNSEKMQEVAQSISTNYMSPVVWGQITGMAKTFIASGALPSHLKNAAQVAMCLQAGYEMGMKPMESIQSLYLVNGQFNIYGKAVVNRFKVHDYNIRYEGETDESCTAIVTGKGREKYEYTYLFKDAEASGHTEGAYGLKNPWKLGINRKRKLRYGALSMIIHTYIPHVLSGAQEIQEVFEDAMPEPAKKDTPKIDPPKPEEGEIVEPVEDVEDFIKNKKKEKAIRAIDESKKKSTEKPKKEATKKSTEKSS